MTMQKKDTLIIIPAYNEGKTIGNLLDQLLSTDASRFGDVLVVNDASADNTKDVVLSFKGRVVLINHVFNQGYGASLKTGYRYARRNGYHYVIQMDADGQHALINLSRMYERMKQKDAPDILIGSRFMRDSQTFPISFVKKTAIRYFRFIIRKSTGKDITDPTSGLQMLNEKAFCYYDEFNHFDLKYPDANMIIKMLMLGYKMEEMPAVMYARQEGVSIHSGLKPILYMIVMCISTASVLIQYRGKGRRREFD